MKARLILAGAATAAFMALGLAGPAQAAAPGYATTDVNMRTGPSTRYQVIRVVPGGGRVTIYGCLQGRSWCDVRYGGHRGWVSAHYLNRGGYRPPRHSYRPAPRHYDPPYRGPSFGFGIFIGPEWDDDDRHHRRKHWRKRDRDHDRKHWRKRHHDRHWHHSGARERWQNRRFRHHAERYNIESTNAD